MSFEPRFYWTGDFAIDAELINKPYIEAEGFQEDRTVVTLEIMKICKDYTSFEISDMLNIQNHLLKQNNWKGITPGFRQHNVSFDNTADYTEVQALTNILFPVSTTCAFVSALSIEAFFLDWYKEFQEIHPLSDLNGRVAGIIVSVLYKQCNQFF